VTVDLVRAHRWNVTTGKANEIQRTQRRHLVLQPLEEQPSMVAGVDVSVRDGRATSAVVLLSFPELKPMEAAAVDLATPLPEQRP